jgi:hypothetical protein
MSTPISAMRSWAVVTPKPGMPSSRAILPRITPRAISASTFGSRSPAAIAPGMPRPETPWMSLITDDSFRCPSSSSFSQRSFCAVRIWTSFRRQRVCVRSRRISSGGTKLPASDPHRVGRSPVSTEIAALIELLATENNGWGYKKMQVSYSRSATGSAHPPSAGFSRP